MSRQTLQHRPQPKSDEFLPTTQQEMARRNWRQLDILLVSGDAYVDHPGFGIPLLARLLESKGYKVCIVNDRYLEVDGTTYLFSKSRKHGRWIAKAF